jgi:peptidoglycan/LPS O-acetylase OafA/YrhL
LFALYKLRDTNKWVAKYYGALAFLSVLLTLGFVFVYKGWWIQSILVLVVILLMFIILPSSALLSERRR